MIINMLLLNTKFEGLSVASIQSGHRVARLTQAIINPHTLSIAAFYVDDGHSDDHLVLHVDDIRDVSTQGVIIDNDDQIMTTDDLVRLDELMTLNFHLINKPVITEKKQRLGKVSEYTIDCTSFKIVRLQVRQSLMKNFSNTGLIIARSQIVKVTDHEVIVHEASIKEPRKQPATKVISEALSSLAPNPTPEVSESQSSSDNA